MKKLKRVEKGQIKTKITPDFILNQYEEIKKIKDPKKREERYETLKVLSENVGKYLVLKDG